MRLLSIAYAVISYAIFLLVMLYAMGFINNIIVPKKIDGGAPGDLFHHLFINTALIVAFAIQHSVMARRGFKQRLTNFISPRIERSTYVLASSVILAFVFWQWRPLGGVVWDVRQTPFAYLFIAINLLGWLVLLISTFLLDHFKLFGLKQAFAPQWPPAEGRQEVLRQPAFYKFVRHPIYFGFILAFWATPIMSYTHFFFALAMLIYIFIGVYFEEKDLLNTFGEEYKQYRQKVAMIFPFIKSNIFK